MTFETCLRLTEILSGSAIFLQSAEFLSLRGENRNLFLVRAGLALLLIAGSHPALASGLLLLIGLFLIIRFAGPYNGGSDRMTLLILMCLFVATAWPNPFIQKIAIGYLAIQVILSYFIAGVVKVAKKQWRDGTALPLVLCHSNYPMVPAMRNWATHQQTLFLAGWFVVIAELAFPLALLNPTALAASLFAAGFFHFLNAIFFGLNRFFWIWIASYPAVLWFQSQIFIQ